MSLAARGFSPEQLLNHVWLKQNAPNSMAVRHGAGREKQGILGCRSGGRNAGDGPHRKADTSNSLYCDSSSRFPALASTHCGVLQRRPLGLEKGGSAVGEEMRRTL